MDAASVAAEPQHLISNTHQQYDYRHPAPPSAPSAHELQGVGQVAAGRGMTLDERAVMLAAAVSIDFDYFSRHSSMGHGGFMPFGMFGGGSEHNQGQVSGGVGDAGAGMMGGAMGGAMGGVMGGYHDDQQQKSPQDQAPGTYSEQIPSPHGDQPPMDPWQYGSGQESPYFPPQEQEPQNGDGGGDFWFFDEE
jgi:hypothetical protein